VLKQGGKVCCFSPCIEQVMKNCEEMNALGFGLIETVEALGRNFE
jgi:tRNA (adenine57-N1/adenine58-N1)-methyltransferase